MKVCATQSIVSDEIINETKTQWLFSPVPLSVACLHNTVTVQSSPSVSSLLTAHSQGN
jgi:hypothetical protein